MKTEGRSILYISYTGLLEPLGESQVYRYLDRLSEKHNVSLITFEKDDKRRNAEKFESMKKKVAESGIQWHPLRYHKSPTVPATVWDLAKGFITSAQIIRKEDIDIVHSRSYVSSILGLLCKKIFETAFVFDMRGFWADERVEGDIWDAESQLYRVAKWFEMEFIRGADTVVSLTDSGIEAMRQFNHVKTDDIRFKKIPTCVDLDIFSPTESGQPDEFVMGYVGSVGTWYLFDDVVDCFRLLQEERPDAKLSILNQGDHEMIREKLREQGINKSVVSLKSVPHEEVPQEMNRMDIGAFFIKPTFSKRGSSPTKMGEFLACGIPCLCNAGVGDVEQIVEENDVGVAIDSFDGEAKRKAVKRILELTEQSDTATRCREVAESYYSLEEGVKSYDEIYHMVSPDT